MCKPETKINLLITKLLVALGVIGILSMAPANAQISMSPSVVQKGNTIEVLGPGPNLQDIIDNSRVVSFRQAAC